MLKSNHTSDMSFDFDSIFSLSGNSFPYLQYTIARLLSVIRKAKRGTSPDYTKLEQEDWKLVHLLGEFEHTLDTCVRANSLHHLADYLFEVSNTANTLYEKHRINTDTDTTRASARIRLIQHTATVLRYGLSLMGIRTEERM
jgi:arginyl-tRNA synthetase